MMYGAYFDVSLWPFSSRGKSNCAIPENVTTGPPLTASREPQIVRARGDLK